MLLRGGEVLLDGRSIDDVCRGCGDCHAKSARVRGRLDRHDFQVLQQLVAEAGQTRSSMLDAPVRTVDGPCDPDRCGLAVRGVDGDRDNPEHSAHHQDRKSSAKGSFGRF